MPHQLSEARSSSSSSSNQSDHGFRLTGSSPLAVPGKRYGEKKLLSYRNRSDCDVDFLDNNCILALSVDVLSLLFISPMACVFQVSGRSRPLGLIRLYRIRELADSFRVWQYS